MYIGHMMQRDMSTVQDWLSNQTCCFILLHYGSLALHDAKIKLCDNNIVHGT